MQGTFVEVAVKKAYKTAQLQFQLEEDINLPEMKPDLDVPIAQKWNIITKNVKVGNGKVCVEGEVEYLILYSREDSTGRLEVLNGTFPFNQCLLMEDADKEEVMTNLSVTAEQVKKRNNRKLSVLLTIEMEAKREGKQVCSFMEDVMEDVEKKPGKLDVLALYQSGKEVVDIKEIVALPSNRPDVRRILMEQTQLRGVEVRLEDGKFVIRGEVFIFVLYESNEENVGMQFLELSIPIEREEDCGFCREDLELEYVCDVVQSSLNIQPNEDGEERDFSLHLEMELRYELKEPREIDYLEDAYALQEEMQLTREEMEFEKVQLCNSRRIRVSEVFSPPMSEKMLQTFPMKGEVTLSEPEVVEDGILVEGTLHVDVLYLTVNPTDPPAVAKVHLPFHQLIEDHGIKEPVKVRVKGDLVQLAANILDSSQAEIKGAINLTVCVYRRQRIPVITKIDKFPRERQEGQMPGIIGYVVQKGDSLWTLAKENRTTVADIMQTNAMTDELLRENEKIVICRNL